MIAPRIGRQLRHAQLRDEQLGKLLIGVLKVNRRKLLVVEVVAARRPVAERLEDSRDRRDPRQRLLRRKRAKGDVIVDKRRLRLANHLLIRLHIRHSLPVAVPQRIEQLRAESLPRG